MQLEDIVRRVDALENTAVSYMCEMTKIPALGPSNGGNGECARADKIQSFLKGFDSVERYDTEDRNHPGIMRPNIVARKQGKKNGTVWFVTHMDVVPVGNESDWIYPPFDPVVVDGKIYGRGTEDNGQSLIGSIIASMAVVEEKFEGMSLALAIVCDEETGSEHGIKHLIDLGLFSEDDFILVPDWGSPGGTMVDVAEKHILWTKISVTGKQAHASVPNEGVNAYRVAVEYMIDLLSKLENRYSATDEMFRPSASTFEPTKASANEDSINMIPGGYEFYMDCRILPQYDINEILGYMKDIASEHSSKTGAKIEVSAEQANVSGKPSETQNEKFRMFSESVSYVKGLEVKPAGIGGGTCANFFRLAGMNAYAWGSDGGTLHQPNEYVSIGTMMEDAKVFATVMYKMCVKGE